MVKLSNTGEFQFLTFVEGGALPLNIAQELVNLVGTRAEYYILLKSETGIDPFYGETIGKWNFKDPIEMRVYWQPDPSDPTRRDPTERGEDQHYPGIINIPRKTAEETGLGAPTEGDMIRVWHTEGYGFVDYDIVKCKPTGYFGDQPTGMFTGFECEIRRRTKFLPERRTTEGQEAPNVVPD